MAGRKKSFEEIHRGVEPVSEVEETIMEEETPSIGNNNYTTTSQEQNSGSNNSGNVIGWIERLSKFIKDNGLKQTAITMITLILVIFIGYYAANPKAMIDRIETIREQSHAEMVVARQNADPYIRASLVNLRNTTNADRAFVFETHNGGQNITGLPFLYVDMTYDEPREGMYFLSNEYKNISQSRYSIVDSVYHETIWCGHIEKLREADPELYFRMIHEGTKYVAMITIYGNHVPVGAVGISYNHENIPSEQEIRRALYKYSNEIHPYLVAPKPKKGRKK